MARRISHAARETAHRFFRIAGTRSGVRLNRLNLRAMDALADRLDAMYDYALELGNIRDARYFRRLGTWVRRQANAAWVARDNRAAA